MDEFGVLVQSIGFKGQRNSAPMADLKNKRHVTPPKSIFNNNNNNNFNSTQKNYSDFEDGFGNYKSNSTPSGIDGFDLDSMFKGSGGLGVNKSIYADDDIFGGVPAQQSASSDEFCGGFGGLEMGSNGSKRKSEDAKKTNSSGFDDLISGFGDKNPVINRGNTGKIRPPPPAGDSVKPVSSSAGDPFIVLEQSSSQVYTSGNNSKPKGQDASEKSTFSSIDDLNVFATGGQQKNTSHQSGFFQNENVANDFDSILNMARQPTNASRTKSTEVDPVFDSLFQNKKTSMEERGPTVEKTPGTSTSKKEATPRKNIVDDFLFFGEATTSSDVFQEVEGESNERRKARFNQHMRTQERMAKALAEKNQRDIRTQQEQDERHRVAETMNDNIKRWAAGKEGNLRALLSSLQHVLWSECGWQPVSLTDLITSVSVKKVYFKATLCVHPDKVQQKGASVQQKYIAEKVFDLLKEAWNKFNAEELR